MFKRLFSRICYLLKKSILINFSHGQYLFVKSCMKVTFCKEFEY